MLGSILKDLIRPGTAKSAPQSDTRRVLNVGGDNKSIAIPGHYDGWQHMLLDIDSRGNPDVVCDARKLTTLRAAQFDAVYCSHNLEHYYPHDVATVLSGFLHLLKADGFTEIKCPDIMAVLKHVAQSGMDLGDVLYQSQAGPITAHDVVYGFGKEIERSGQDFYAHKTGFSAKSLRGALERAGFPAIFVFESPGAFEVRALAFRAPPTADQRRVFGLPAA